MKLLNTQLATTFIIAIGLSGCAVAPKTLDGKNSDERGIFERKVITDIETSLDFDGIRPADYKTPLTRIAKANTYAHNDNLEMQRLSRGDLLRLRIHGMDTYDGLYQINSNGQIELPINESVFAVGLTRSELVSKLQSLFHMKGWFLDGDTLIDVSLVRAASIDVSVYGAAFNPGRVTINAQPAGKQEDAIQQINGSYANERNLTAAIRAAGGIRPDADLTTIVLVRGGNHYLIDLSRLISGASFNTAPNLIHGDQIHIASNGIENPDLIRPSQITPPGMRVLMSNLTAPALSNAQSAIGADATRLPYGSSLLDGAVSANCVGGTHHANASRTVILITRHHGSKQQLVIKRSINELLANSSRHHVNPFLMPNDGIACYDSRFTNLRDVARGIGDIFGPVILRGVL